MPHVMPQIAVQRVLQAGIKQLKDNPSILDDIFCFYLVKEMEADYGQAYIDKIKQWFEDTKVPVVQAWSFNPQRIPSISVHLASEREDEQKAAIGDYWGSEDGLGEIGVGVFNVTLDIGLHASKNGDQVLWLYYITSYILFKSKRLCEELGLQLQTFSATDYAKSSQYMADNIWTRWIRFTTTVENFWDGSPYLDIDNLNVDVSAGTESQPEPTPTSVPSTNCNDPLLGIYDLNGDIVEDPPGSGEPAPNPLNPIEP